MQVDVVYYVPTVSSALSSDGRYVVVSRLYTDLSFYDALCKSVLDLNGEPH